MVNAYFSCCYYFMLALFVANASALTFVMSNSTSCFSHVYNSFIHMCAYNFASNLGLFFLSTRLVAYSSFCLLLLLKLVYSCNALE